MTAPTVLPASRRGILGLLLAGTLLPPARLGHAALPPDKAELVRRVETYLNGIRTISARFNQVNPDGSFSSGSFQVDRGRATMRFDYDPPSEILLVAPGDWRLIFSDGTARQVNVLPVGETPLGFMLSKQVRLDGGEEVSVVEATREKGEIVLALMRPSAPDQGKVRLAFVERPIEMRRWAVTDPQGLTTVVILEGMVLNKPIDPDVFIWRDPQIFGWPIQ
jgi:outer membrane lipoprotein-sorting protein